MPLSETATEDNARPTIREPMAHTMPLPEKTSDTVIRTTRKIIGVTDVAVRHDKRHREADEAKTDGVADAAVRGDKRHREAGDKKAERRARGR